MLGRLAACASLIGALALLTQPAEAQESTPVVVNEILYDQTDTRTEFIELFNRSDQVVDLQSIMFSDNRENMKPIVETEHLLAPGDYAVLVDDADLFAADFPGVPFIVPPRWDGLNNGGDAVVLYRDGVVIERVDYTPSWGGGDGLSLERIDPFGPSNQASNFGTATAPGRATPGAVNSIYAPDTAPPTGLFAEQHAPSELLVFFDEPLDPASVTPDAFELDDGRTPERLATTADGTRVTLTFASALTGDYVSLTGLSDPAGNRLSATALPIHYQPAPGEVVINEIMFDPLADDFDDRPNQPEYVELMSTASRPLTLRRGYWTDRPTETGEADTVSFGDRFAALPPEGFAVAFAQPDPVAQPAQASTLARAFPATDFSRADVTLLPIPSHSLGLLNNGSLIRLHQADGDPLAAVAYDPDWHAPGLVETKGVALARISPDAPAQDPQAWTSSVDPSGGTPGRPNSVFIAPAPQPPASRLVASPSPFSPDGDGHDDATRLQFTLQAEASLVRLRIYDARGRQVYADEGERVGRRGELIWNGRGTDGRALRLGIYVALLEAVDATGGTVETLRETVVLARPFP